MRGWTTHHRRTQEAQAARAAAKVARADQAAAPAEDEAAEAAGAAPAAAGAAANETGTTTAAPAEDEAAEAAGAAANETGTTTAAPAEDAAAEEAAGAAAAGAAANETGTTTAAPAEEAAGAAAAGAAANETGTTTAAPAEDAAAEEAAGAAPAAAGAAANETGTTTAAPAEDAAAEEAGAAANETGTTTAAPAEDEAAEAAGRGPSRGRGGGGGGGRGPGGDYRGSKGRGGPNRGAGQRGTTPVRRRDQDHGETRGLGGDRVEGRHAVKELLLAGTRPVRQVVLAADQDESPILDEIIDLADEAGVDIRELPRGRFDQMAATDAPQGVVAFAAPLREFAVEELVAGLSGGGSPGDSNRLYLSGGAEHAERRTPPPPEEDPASTEGHPEPGGQPHEQIPEEGHGAAGEHEEAPPEGTTDPGAAPVLLLVVDGVNDPGNLGAILRTAECAGVTGVVLPRHRAARITPTVAKRAAGAIEHLRFAPVSGIPTALATLAELGVWSVGLDVTADETIWQLDIAEAPLALVLGAEGRGLSRLVRRRCDVTARIPVTGQLDALNVSSAAAIALFEVLRRRSTA